MKFPFREAKDGGLNLSYVGGTIRRHGAEAQPLLFMPCSVEVKQEGGKDSRVLRFIASTESEDRDGDIIRVAGWELENFLSNPVQLWAHNMRSDNPPIGKSVKLERRGGQLINVVDFFMVGQGFDLADLAFKMHLAGVGAESVGFIPKEAMERRHGDGRLIGFEFKKQELLEISSVPVPSNPEALLQAREKGLLTSDEATKIEKVWSPESVRPIEIVLTEKGAPAAKPATKCAGCGNEFDLAAQPEVAQGAVKCPGCGATLDQEGKVVAPAPTAEARAIEAAKADALTLSEDDRRAKQLHHIRMAEAYGLKTRIETGSELKGLDEAIAGIGRAAESVARTAVVA